MFVIADRITLCGLFTGNNIPLEEQGKSVEIALEGVFGTGRGGVSREGSPLTINSS